MLTPLAHVFLIRLMIHPYNAPSKLVRANVLTLWEDSIISSVLAIFENNHASSTAHILNLIIKQITALEHKHKAQSSSTHWYVFIKTYEFCGSTVGNYLMRGERLVRTVAHALRTRRPRLAAPPMFTVHACTAQRLATC